MKNINWKKVGYSLGIGLGIVFVTAFMVSQVILPLIFGRGSHVDTPEVIGMRLSQAKRILREERLHAVVTDSVYSESARLDQVIEQSPTAGTRLKEDGVVYLVISKGSKMVQVPDIIGYNFQEALITLRNSELRTTIVDSLYSDEQPRNSVLRMSPMAGGKVEKNTLVKLYLSRGPETPPDSSYFEIWDF